jgi:hypothetical protein
LTELAAVPSAHVKSGRVSSPVAITRRARAFGRRIFIIARSELRTSNVEAVWRSMTPSHFLKSVEELPIEDPGKIMVETATELSLA